MGTQIEKPSFDTTGTPVTVTVQVASDAYAAALADIVSRDWAHQGWREEIFELSADKSVQVTYDSLGNVWETYEYRRLDPVPEGYVTLV